MLELHMMPCCINPFCPKDAKTWRFWIIFSWILQMMAPLSLLGFVLLITSPPTLEQEMPMSVL